MTNDTAPTSLGLPVRRWVRFLCQLGLNAKRQQEAGDPDGSLNALHDAVLIITVAMGQAGAAMKPAHSNAPTSAFERFCEQMAWVPVSPILLWVLKSNKLTINAAEAQRLQELISAANDGRVMGPYQLND